MTTIVVIAIIVIAFYFVKIALRGGSKNSEEKQIPQSPNIGKSDVQHEKTSLEEMQVAKEKYLQEKKNKSESSSKEEESKEVKFPPSEPGYFYNEMVGMYNLGVTPNEFGVYEGYAIAETNNPHDKFAVGIHRSNDGKLIGYVPREFRGKSNEVVHRDISSIGGRAKAVIKITGSAQRSYGTVYIKA